MDYHLLYGHSQKIRLVLLPLSGGQDQFGQGNNSSIGGKIMSRGTVDLLISVR